MLESKLWLEKIPVFADRGVRTGEAMQVLSDLAEQYPSSQLLIIQTDAVESSQVIAAFAKAKEVFGHIDVVSIRRV